MYITANWISLVIAGKIGWEISTTLQRCQYVGVYRTDNLQATIFRKDYALEKKVIEQYATIIIIWLVL